MGIICQHVFICRDLTPALSSLLKLQNAVSCRHTSITGRLGLRVAILKWLHVLPSKSEKTNVIGNKLASTAALYPNRLGIELHARHVGVT